MDKKKKLCARYRSVTLERAKPPRRARFSSQIDKTMKKVTLNSKYYREHQCTSNVLMFDGVKTDLSTHGLRNN